METKEQRPSFKKLSDLSKEKIPERSSRSKSRKKRSDRASVITNFKEEPSNLTDRRERTWISSDKYQNENSSVVSQRNPEAMRELIKLKNRVTVLERKIKEEQTAINNESVVAKHFADNRKGQGNSQLDTRLKQLKNQLEETHIQTIFNLKAVSEKYAEKVEQLSSNKQTTVKNNDKLIVPKFEKLPQMFTTDMPTIMATMDRIESFQSRYMAK